MPTKRKYEKKTPSFRSQIVIHSDGIRLEHTNRKENLVLNVFMEQEVKLEPSVPVTLPLPFSYKNPLGSFMIPIFLQHGKQIQITGFQGDTNQPKVERPVIVITNTSLTPLVLQKGDLLTKLVFTFTIPFVIVPSLEGTRKKQKKKISEPITTSST
jgi:hypothetical protein